MAELTADYLRERLDYDPKTGVFTWRSHKPHGRTWNTRFAGKTAGSEGRHGYWVIGLCGKVHLAHRLAWLYQTGEWPTLEVDHKNRRKTDNRWANLRPASRAQNNRNISVPSHNTSGVKGVTWHRRDRHWRAQIRVNGKEIWLGGFDTISEAAAAYAAAAKKHFGAFATDGRPA